MFFFLFLDSHISEVSRPIAAKLYHMIEIWLESPIKVGKFGGPPQKNFRGQKHAKFRSIFCNVRLWPWTSPERLKIQRMRLNNFRVSGSILTGLLSVDAPLCSGDNLGTILKGPPPKICDRQKIVQNFSRFLTTLTLIANISGMQQQIENRNSS